MNGLAQRAVTRIIMSIDRGLDVATDGGLEKIMFLEYGRAP